MADLPEPVAEVTLSGTTVSRGHVKNDYGNRIHWKVTRNGAVIATQDARVMTSYTHVDEAPGLYEIVLETWKHLGYQSKSLGNYIEISNKVSFRV